jgi:hypothetical protein
MSKTFAQALDDLRTAVDQVDRHLASGGAATLDEPQLTEGTWTVKDKNNATIGVMYIAKEGGSTYERLASTQAVPLSGDGFSFEKRTTNTYSPGGGDTDSDFLSWACTDIHGSSGGTLNWLKAKYLATGTHTC